MKRLSMGNAAPEFILFNHEGTPFTLSHLYNKQHVLLVFNLGFV